MYWCFTPFYGQVVFHHVERPQFISLLISWWYSDCFHSLVILDNAYKNIHKWVLVGHMFLVTLNLSPLGALPDCSPKRLPVSAPLSGFAVSWSTLVTVWTLACSCSGGCEWQFFIFHVLIGHCICSLKEMATHPSILAWKIPWLLPVGCSPWGCKQWDMTERFHFREKFIQIICPFYIWVVRVLSVFCIQVPYEIIICRCIHTFCAYLFTFLVMSLETKRF